MDAIPIERDLIIYQGTDFDVQWQVLNPDESPMDFTGYRGRMQGRETYASPNTIFDLNTENQTLMLTDIGQIQGLLTAQQTSLISAATGVWELELEAPSGKKYRLLYGRFYVSPEVTHA